MNPLKTKKNISQIQIATKNNKRKMMMSQLTERLIRPKEKSTINTLRMMKNYLQKKKDIQGDQK